MKIIVVNEKNSEGQYSVFLKPDTCIARNNRPFYTPDYIKQLGANVYLIFKINRLGKHINLKNANRYYNEVSASVSFYDIDAFKNALKIGDYFDLSLNFDYSLPLGNFISLDNSINYDFEVCINENIIKINTSNHIDEVNSVIEYVSQFITIHIGDILMLKVNNTDVNININDEIKVEYDNKPILLCDIK